MLGLTNLAWFEHAKREGSLAIGDCRECMSRTTRLQRQSLACGFEPPAPKCIPVNPWSHSGRTARPDEEKICARYTTQLPQTIEVARARLHWDKGQLQTFTKGEPPSDRLIEGIEILEGSINSYIDWRHEEARKKAG